jgi:hypothetical protein
MALYKVLERSFVNNALLEEGAIVEYSGEVSANLELIKAADAKKIDHAVVTKPE